MLQEYGVEPEGQRETQRGRTSSEVVIEGDVHWGGMMVAENVLMGHKDLSKAGVGQKERGDQVNTCNLNAVHSGARDLTLDL